ncbi:MAG: alpha/beta fold hydrolase [Rhodospirillaceae bacterium]|nr:MAG: alpha/beta fold hydrolase [Rhodospirillaceae bacterium]
MPTFILIHGAFHGGWCWEHVVPLLEAAGHRAIAPNLPGMGGDPTPLNQVTLARTGDFVANLVRLQPEPVILAGHSLGGLAISEAAERAPDHIAGLVYVTALLAPSGASSRDFHDPSRQGESAVRAADRVADTFESALAPDLFYNSCDTTEVDRAIARLTPQPVAPLNEPVTVTPERFGRVRRAYIECIDDHAIPLARQRQMQAALPCDPVFTMTADHSPFLCAPDELTKHLIAAAAAMTRM